MNTCNQRRTLKALCTILTVGWGSLAASSPGSAKAGPALVVALGASQTYGKGVARGEDFPAQLQALLKADGRNVRVINAGINGDATGGMLARMNAAVPKGTKLVILQPGGNDRRLGTAADREGNIAEIQSRLSAQGVAVIVLENSAFRGMPRGPDGQHLTPDGYHMIAEQLLPEVEQALSQ